MSDVKLFRIDHNQVTELAGDALQVEKSLQFLFESNLEPLLGIRFLATEHSTGPVHGGRIDTLGLDEDDCPVILEFKRAVNENVINQGLYYLDWLPALHEPSWGITNSMRLDGLPKVGMGSSYEITLQRMHTSTRNFSVSSKRTRPPTRTPSIGSRVYCLVRPARHSGDPRMLARTLA